MEETCQAHSRCSVHGLLALLSSRLSSQARWALLSAPLCFPRLGVGLWKPSSGFPAELQQRDNRIRSLGRIWQPRHAFDRQGLAGGQRECGEQVPVQAPSSSGFQDGL